MRRSEREWIRSGAFHRASSRRVSRRADLDGAERRGVFFPLRDPARGGAALIRVLIVDDQRLFADVIRSALENRGVEVVGVAGDAQQALEDWRRTRAEVVLVDLGLPGEDGIAVGKRILEEGPETKVLIVSALNDAKAVGDALRAGFSGYLTKDTPLSHLLTQMEAVVRGEIVVQARLAAGATEKKSSGTRHSWPSCSVRGNSKFWPCWPRAPAAARWRSVWASVRIPSGRTSKASS
ncbi:MAG: response regulator transcription factor [Actinobacteria bacterium]|nr:MAG: response regulator transcription factor [Actinomycetota bacterium]